MKPLIVQLLAFGIAWVILKLSRKENAFYISGRVGLAAMLCFTAIGHFAFVEGMSMMLPNIVPYKSELIILTGILEILGAAGLFFAKWRKLSAYLLIVFFFLVLPANIYAALHHVDYQRATYQGPGTEYLVFRVPLQILFILWAYYFGIRYAHRR